jgi:hypothetical protein
MEHVSNQHAWSELESLGDQWALGMSANDVRNVTRRQLIGSVVVAIGIAVFAGLTELRPAYSEPGAVATHPLAKIQQPTFVTLPEERVAALK